MIAYAGMFKSTNGNGTAQGFVEQNATARVPYDDGTLVNGILSSPLGGVGQLTIPLVPGMSSFGPSGTASPLGPVSGTSYMSADGTFFYADLTPANAPAQREFISGGMPVKASFLAPTGSTRIFAFQIQPDAALQQNIPFIRGNVGGSLANATVSPLYLVAPATTAIGDATTVSAARVLQSSLAIDGQGADQQSVLVMGIGTVDALQSSGAPVISGVLRGTSQLSAAAPPIRIGSSLTSVVDGNGNSLYGANSISGFVLDQTEYASSATGSGVLTNPVIPSTADEIPLSGPATSYGFNQPATPTSAGGVGANRRSLNLSGYFGGIMNTTAQALPYQITGTTTLSTDAATNRIAATLTSGPLNPSETGGVSNIQMQFGGLSGDAGGREAFIGNNVFGVAESQTTPQQINGNPLVVDGNFAQAGKLYLLSSGAAPPPNSLLPDGAAYCQCQYLKWGYWGGDLLTGNSTNDNISRIDRGNINFWAAGPPTPIGQINSLVTMGATASYSGHLIGSVFNSGAQYIAAGGLNASYNFGTGFGRFTVNNYDHLSFVATGTSTLTNGQYSFTLNNPSGLPLTGTVKGGFFGPAAAETGGSFAFSAGRSYFTSGIFAAAKIP